MDRIIKRKLTFLHRHFGFSYSELNEIQAMYEGEYFNPQDPSYLRLVTLSQELCERYTRIYGSLKQKASVWALVQNYLSLAKIRRLLCPHHHGSLLLRGGASFLIGQVNFGKGDFANIAFRVAPSCRVKLGSRVRIGPHVSFGQEQPEVKEGKIRFPLITIGDDAWLGFGVRIASGVSIGPRSVVGAGAFVTSSFSESSLVLGQPAVLKRNLEGNKAPSSPIPLPYSPEEKAKLKAHLTALGFKRSWPRYERFLDGKEFVDVGNLKLGRLFLLTHRLSAEYSDPNTSETRRQEILHLLFPLQGANLKAGKTLYVDLLGTTRFGNDVSIGDGDYFSGNLVFEDRVTLQENVGCFCSSHYLDYRKRQFGFSLKEGFTEWGRPDGLLVKEGVTIGAGALLIPNSILTQNVAPGALAGGHHDHPAPKE
jgi:acetyltransferase-like isoleucine patch superfamily enzyme